ncbi:uncharacterized protein LOC135202263 [Macrobrachium nipponense]|uniref:uncharacterized protein LOC135202263 n=1 Tax=Macrobrachium nipponense TaxID=159736 RepID=UPI0030C7EC50
MASTERWNRDDLYKLLVWPLLSVAVIFLTVSIGAIAIMGYDAFKICRKIKLSMFLPGVRRGKFKVNEDPPVKKRPQVSSEEGEIATVTVAEIVNTDCYSSSSQETYYNLSDSPLSKRSSRISLPSSELSAVSGRLKEDTRPSDDYQHLVIIERTDSEEAGSSSYSGCSDPSMSSYSSSVDTTPSNEGLPTPTGVQEINHSVTDTETSPDYVGYDQTNRITSSVEPNSTTTFPCILPTLSDRDNTDSVMRSEIRIHSHP